MSISALINTILESVQREGADQKIPQEAVAILDELLKEIRLLQFSANDTLPDDNSLPAVVDNLQNFMKILETIDPSQCGTQILNQLANCACVLTFSVLRCATMAGRYFLQEKNEAFVYFLKKLQNTCAREFQHALFHAHIDFAIYAMKAMRSFSSYGNKELKQIFGLLEIGASENEKVFSGAIASCIKLFQSTAKIMIPVEFSHCCILMNMLPVASKLYDVPIQNNIQRIALGKTTLRALIEYERDTLDQQIFFFRIYLLCEILLSTEIDISLREQALRGLEYYVKEEQKEFSAFQVMKTVLWNEPLNKKGVISTFLYHCYDKIDNRSLKTKIDLTLELPEPIKSDSEDQQFFSDLRTTRSLIEEGLPGIQASPEEEIVLMIGNTGAGKSTLISVMMGIPLVEFEDGGDDVLDYDLSFPLPEKCPIIGHACTKAQTVLPGIFPSSETTSDGKPHRFYCDPPGFEHTESSQKPGIALLLESLAVNRKFKGVVIVLSASNFAQEGRAKAFLQLLNTLNRLCDINEIKNHCVFAITHLSKGGIHSLDRLKKRISKIAKELLEEKQRWELEFQEHFPEELRDQLEHIAKNVSSGLFNRIKNAVLSMQKNSQVSPEEIIGQIQILIMIHAALESNRVLLVDLKTPEAQKICRESLQVQVNTLPEAQDFSKIFHFEKYDSACEIFEKKVTEKIVNDIMPKLLAEKIIVDQCEILEKSIHDITSEIQQDTRLLEQFSNSSATIDALKQRKTENIDNQEQIKKELRYLHKQIYRKQEKLASISSRESASRPYWIKRTVGGSSAVHDDFRMDNKDSSYFNEQTRITYGRIEKKEEETYFLHDCIEKKSVTDATWQMILEGRKIKPAPVSEVKLKSYWEKSFIREAFNIGISPSIVAADAIRSTSINQELFFTLSFFLIGPAILLSNLTALGIATTLSVPMAMMDGTILAVQTFIGKKGIVTGKFNAVYFGDSYKELDCDEWSSKQILPETAEEERSEHSVFSVEYQAPFFPWNRRCFDIEVYVPVCYMPGHPERIQALCQEISMLTNQVDELERNEQCQIEEINCLDQQITDLTYALTNQLTSESSQEIEAMISVYRANLMKKITNNEQALIEKKRQHKQLTDKILPFQKETQQEIEYIRMIHKIFSPLNIPLEGEREHIQTMIAHWQARAERAKKQFNEAFPRRNTHASLVELITGGLGIMPIQRASANYDENMKTRKRSFSF